MLIQSSDNDVFGRAVNKSVNEELVLNIMRRLYHSMKSATDSILGRSLNLVIPIEFQEITKKRLGSVYGGYWIHKDNLDSESIVYSVGIGDDLTFDLELVEEVGCQVFAFDPTPKSVEWMTHQELPPRISFKPWGVSESNHTTQFYPPLNPKHMSHSLVKHSGSTNKGVSVDFRNLATIMENLGHHSINLLKMDIEGSEYDVIKNISKNRIPIDQLCVEFHHRFSSFDIENTREAIKDLLKIGLYPFAQDGETCSFLRLDCVG